MPQVALISAIPCLIDYVGDKYPAAGWYGPTTGLHTVAIQANNFRGSVSVQGSLALNPQDADWFPIALGGQTILTYPQPSLLPISGPGWNGETSTMLYNFVVNCLWLRASMIRSDIIPPEATECQVAIYGVIDSIIVQY